MPTTARPAVSAPPEQQAARVKGTLVITVMKYLRAHGLDVDAVLSRLPAPEQELARGILLPSSWYPARLFAALVDATAAVAAAADRAELLTEMGRFSAQTNLGPGGVRRAYVHPGDPHHVLAVVPRIHPSAYSAGRRAYERTGDRSVVIRGYDTEMLRGHCQWTVGWLERIVALSGGKAVRVVEAQCQGSGAPCCEFRIDWA